MRSDRWHGVVRLVLWLALVGWQVVARAEVATPPCLEGVSLLGHENIWVIPTAGKISGKNGTHWVTDLEVQNPWEAEVEFGLWLIERGAAPFGGTCAGLRVGAHRLLELRDVIENVFGRTETAGTLVLSADRRLVVGSRTYNDANGGTYGQMVGAVPLAQALRGGQQGVLVQLKHNASFRTNLGLAALWAGTIEVSVFRTDGTLIGARSFALGTHTSLQANDLIAGLTSEPVDAAYAVISSRTPGTLFMAHASVIDNRTGDGIHILAQQSGHPPGARQFTFDNRANAVLVDRLPQAVGFDTLPAGVFSASAGYFDGPPGTSGMVPPVVCMYKNPAGLLRAAVLRNTVVSDVGGGYPFRCFLADFRCADCAGTARVTLHGGGSPLVLELEASRSCVAVGALPEAVYTTFPDAKMGQPSWRMEATGNLGSAALEPNLLVLSAQYESSVVPSVLREGSELAEVDGFIAAVVLDWRSRDDNTGVTQLIAEANSGPSS